ncbi:MAG: DUF4923 family protein [Prevotella sp.]|nr:DUF4923 family protein [Prevotella sp.]
MRKQIKTIAMLLMAFMTAPSVQAQIDLGSVLNSVIGDGASGDDVVSGLTSVFSSSKQATAEKIIGTWSYTEPAIVFTSDNLLAKAASKIAANKVEKKLQEQLDKYGIKPGAFSITFNEDGTCSETVNGKTFKGKWTVSDSKLQLSLAGVKSLAITTQISGKDMQVVTDATKLLNLFKTLGAKSSNSNIKTVASLMKSVNGMQAGVTLRRQ